jgi:hypothetical protein
MTQSLALVQVGLRIGRWVLPWVAVVFVSASLAYAINGAIAGGSSGADQRPDVQVAVSTGEGTGPTAIEWPTTSPAAQAQSADLGPSAFVERCAPIGSNGNGSYVDSSIVAETRKIDCGWAP